MSRLTLSFDPWSLIAMHFAEIKAIFHVSRAIVYQSHFIVRNNKCVGFFDKMHGAETPWIGVVVGYVRHLFNAFEL